MDFGFSLKPLFSIDRIVALTRQAEAAGFSYGWLFDGHVLWKEVYPLLTVMALNTSVMRLGTCVTNPATRDPSVTASALATLDEISGGRMDLGIGRGDNAVRVLGKPPTTMKTLEEAVTVIRDLVEGRTTGYEGADLGLPWTGKWKLPVWIAGYGPMALAMRGAAAGGLRLHHHPGASRRTRRGLTRTPSASGGDDARRRVGWPRCGDHRSTCTISGRTARPAPTGRASVRRERRAEPTRRPSRPQA